MHPLLNTAVKAARRAGAIINRASLDLDLLRIGRKAPNDFVTEVDQAAEAAIIEVLSKAYPDHDFLAEETGTAGASGKRGTASDYVWIIDPLDGTTNFIHGFPQYAVSIGLAHRGQMSQAVIYDPVHNDLFIASKGKGAMLNDRRIRVSQRDRLDESLIGTGFPFRNFESLELYVSMFKELTQKTAGMRRPGAASLDLAYVACGRLDGFFEMGLMPWDAAAGSLLITEAGGLIGNFQGESDYLFHENIIGGSPKIFGQLVNILGKYTLPEPTKGLAAKAMLDSR
ncbi:MAG: inositol monophosphatase [Burkholderiaceae bacterium]|jgi:myo-inositol-1(or 4)-monophosphatase|nr:inositol monophosphatase [Burkholderiaceae bacterium]